jgi:ABC-2 type transport system permease protein
MTLDLVRAEWTKLRSLRSTAWSLLAVVAGTLAITALAASIYTNQYHQLDPTDQARLHVDAIGMILQPAVNFGGIGVCVLAVSAVAGEYSTGMIRASLLAAPRRLPVLVAKAVVLAVVVFVVGELTAVAAFGLGRTIVSSRVHLPLSDPALLRAIPGFGLYLCVLGLFAMGVAALVRHVAAAIALVLTVVLALPSLVALLPGSAGEHVSGYLPSLAGTQLLASDRWPAPGLSAWTGFAVLCGQTAMLLIAAGYLLRRRDA